MIAAKSLALLLSLGALAGTAPGGPQGLEPSVNGLFDAAAFGGVSAREAAKIGGGATNGQALKAVRKALDEEISSLGPGDYARASRLRASRSAYLSEVERGYLDWIISQRPTQRPGPGLRLAAAAGPVGGSRVFDDSSRRMHMVAPGVRPAAMPRGQPPAAGGPSRGGGAAERPPAGEGGGDVFDAVGTPEFMQQVEEIVRQIEESEIGKDLMGRLKQAGVKVTVQYTADQNGYTEMNPSGPNIHWNPAFGKYPHVVFFHEAGHALAAITGEAKQGDEEERRNMGTHEYEGRNPVAENPYRDELGIQRRPNHASTDV